MAWFWNHYICEDCDCSWNDEWSCMCDDECPKCGRAIEPHESDDLTILIRSEGGRHIVSVSPPTAEHGPDYVETIFDTLEEAQSFVDSESNRLDALNAAPQAPSLAVAPPTTLDAVLVPRDLIRRIAAFLGKAQGVCLGVAMSGDDYPDPGGALTDVFHDAQELGDAMRAEIAL